VVDKISCRKKKIELCESLLFQNAYNYTDQIRKYDNDTETETTNMNGNMEQ
jgi:hypothetical protein